jgi:hypothetical protein
VSAEPCVIDIHAFLDVTGAAPCSPLHFAVCIKTRNVLVCACFLVYADEAYSASQLVKSTVHSRPPHMNTSPPLLCHLTPQDKGRRAVQEDRLASGLLADGAVSCVGVFDGHAGSGVANSIAAALPEWLARAWVRDGTPAGGLTAWGEGAVCCACSYSDVAVQRHSSGKHSRIRLGLAIGLLNCS